MKEQFKTFRFNAATLERIEQVNEVLDAYEADGFKLTLRQLYYQLVQSNVIPNTPKSYKTLGGIVSDGRLAGLIDWASIEDRGRVANTPFHYESAAHLMQNIKRSANGFILDRWKGQTNHVELWIEKDALSGIVEPVASRHHVTLMVNKGYSSQSAMYESAERLKAIHQDDVEYGTGELRDLVILYLGDFDPSGEDMVRDITDRMEMFEVRNLTVEKIALTRAQIAEKRLPPNPAKITDPRAKRFIQEHGDHSWELDALRPQHLAEIAEKAILRHVDRDALSDVIAEESKSKAEIKKALESVRL